MSVIFDPRVLRRWYGEMEVEKHVYPAGLAGEVFMKNLKEKGTLTGGYCKKCNIIYVPAKAFCERCFSEINEFREFEPRGVLKSYTRVYVGRAGERLKEPYYVGFVEIPGTYGGIIHRIGGVDEGGIRIGMEVEAVLKPVNERRGSITDILYFKPV